MILLISKIKLILIPNVQQKFKKVLKNWNMEKKMKKLSQLNNQTLIKKQKWEENCKLWEKKRKKKLKLLKSKMKKN